MYSETQKNFDELVKLMEVARNQYEVAIESAKFALNKLTEMVPSSQRIEVEKGFSVEDAVMDYLTIGKPEILNILTETKKDAADTNGRKALRKIEEELDIPHQYTEAKFKVGDKAIYRPLNTTHPTAIRNNGVEVTILRVYEPLRLNTNRMCDVSTPFNDCICVYEKELEEV